MAAYKVTALHGEPSEWQHQSGKKFLSYWLDLEGVEHRVNWNRATDADAPVVGESYDLDLQEKSGKHGPFFKATLAKQDGAGWSGGGGGGKDWEASGRAQGRAHAQEMALRYCALKGQADVNWGDLLKLVDAFYDDAQAAMAGDYRK